MLCVLLFGRALMWVHDCPCARLNFGAVTSPMQHECEILRPQQQYKWKHDFWVSTQFESIYPLRFTNMKWLYNVHCAACIFPRASEKKGILVTILPIFQKHSASHFAPKVGYFQVHDGLHYCKRPLKSQFQVGKSAELAHMLFYGFHMQTITQHAV